MTDHDAGKRPAPSLLIADDDPVVYTVLASQLGPSFDIVGYVHDTDEAIALAVKHRPDVAIIDIDMPGGGGVRAAREIHVQAPATAVVALSADESDKIVRDVVRAGAVTYIRKGTTAAALTSTLQRSIAAHVAQISELDVEVGSLPA